MAIILVQAIVIYADCVYIDAICVRSEHSIVSSPERVRPSLPPRFSSPTSGGISVTWPNTSVCSLKPATRARRPGERRHPTLAS